MFIAMLSEPILDELDLTSLRTGIMAGSPCPVATMNQVIDRMGMSRGLDLLRDDRDVAGLDADPH